MSTGVPGPEWSRSEHRPGANVGVNAMPRTPQHTSCCGAVDELGAAAPQHHRTTAPQHHSHNCVLSSRTGEAVAVVCAAAEVRRTGFLGSVTGPSLHQHQQQDAAAA